jgi:LPS-assembly protein
LVLLPPLRLAAASARASRIHPLAAAVLVLLCEGAAAQSATDPTAPDGLKPSTALQARRGEDGRPLPIILRADAITGRPDLDAVADGDVELRRGATVIRADHLTYDNPSDVAKAQGHVRISRSGNVFSGPSLELTLESFKGSFESPDYFIWRTQAGGHAERVDFLDSQRAQAFGAIYTSCPRDGSGDPAWLLSTSKVTMDFETNTGVAEGAVVRFYGVPILAAPVLSFPLSDARKSGWLPPNITLDSRSGFGLAVPYYWNIAPNRDATITPTVMTRRGAGADMEFRYLEPGHQGRLDLNLLPEDRVAGRERHSLLVDLEGQVPYGVHYRANVLRVSDDEYWKDFSRGVPSITQRLLPLDLRGDRLLDRLPGDWEAYARVQRWQTLNDAVDITDPSTLVLSPYERSPQLGLRGSGGIGGKGAGWGGSGPQYSFEAEFNRFTLADFPTLDPALLNAATQPALVALKDRPTGSRVHALGSISWPLLTSGTWLTPKIGINAASYEVDALTRTSGAYQPGYSSSRVIPTLSVDGGMVFERDSDWFGRTMRQTLEPRVLYVNTPYHRQDNLPNFDSAVKDFNDISVYSENQFSGVDRVSDAHQVTAGVTTRFLNPSTGAEALRLGIAQRYLFRNQRVTADDGPPLTQRFSDVLLLASANLIQKWTFDSTVQYSPDTDRVTRALLGVRYSPGDFRTINLNYRLTRGFSEQVELGWQWPLYGPSRQQRAQSSSSCAGTWYGVGRLNYSLRDSRMTDSLVGVEYDAGCWIGRIVADRVSTGRAEATTRLMFQLELVGLSRLGSNPLGSLKDNIPGYRLLRDGRTESPPNPSYD